MDRSEITSALLTLKLQWMRSQNARLWPGFHRLPLFYDGSVNLTGWKKIKQELRICTRHFVWTGTNKTDNVYYNTFNKRYSSTCFLSLLNMHIQFSCPFFSKKSGCDRKVQVHFLEKFQIKSMFLRIMGPLLRRTIWTLPRPTGGDLFYNTSRTSSHTTPQKEIPH